VEAPLLSTSAKLLHAAHSSLFLERENNCSPLKSEPDGSLKIGFGPKAPTGVPESNWLPSPEGKPFSLTFRTYVPKDSVKRGGWTPPAVTRTQPVTGETVTKIDLSEHMLGQRLINP
jgi:hypothetical protein